MKQAGIVGLANSVSQPPRKGAHLRDPLGSGNARQTGCNKTVQGDRIRRSIHHAVQIEQPSWSSNFCLDPVEAATTRLRLLERIADNGTVLLPAHFGGPTAVQIVSDDRGFFYDAV